MNLIIVNLAGRESHWQLGHLKLLLPASYDGAILLVFWPFALRAVSSRLAASSWLLGLLPIT